jgi:hypothetical protein
MNSKLALVRYTYDAEVDILESLVRQFGAAFRTSSDGSFVTHCWQRTSFDTLVTQRVQQDGPDTSERTISIEYRPRRGCGASDGGVR